MKNLLSFLFLFTASLSVSAQCWLSISAGIDHTVAIKPDGTLWAWGFNGNGQLGDGTLADEKEPVQIGTSSDWRQVAAGGNHCLAIKNDGTLWAWGENFWGQLGDGTFANDRTTPIKIGNDNNWKSITAGRTFSLASKNDGTLWAWGDNFFGQLGNQLSNAWTPQKVGTDSNWKLISAGGNHTMGIKTDGSLWGWGLNDTGQLGDGTTTQRNVPTRIGNATDWQSISVGYSFSMALKTDGTLWTWGTNDQGQLGNGSYLDQHAPQKVGTAKWKGIATGYDNSLAIHVDGSLWSWGWIIGGFGPDNTKSIPTLIHTSTEWNYIVSGENHSFAFQTDGSLWGWGNNDWGKLGDGTWEDQTMPQLLSTRTPSGDTIQHICNAGTLANLQITGTNIRWYNSPTGGVELPASTALTNNTPYYATSTKYFCESTSRLEVLVKINTTPTPAPTGAFSQAFCGVTTLSSLRATGTNIKWYATSTGGPALNEETIVINSAHYFASQTVGGCESTSRLDIIATINSTPAPTGDAFQAKCGGSTVSDLSVSGATIKWYADDNASDSLPANTLLANGNYFATQTVNGQESCSKMPVLVTIVLVEPPLGDANQILCSGKVVSDLKATGEFISWYDSPVGGSVVNTNIPTDGQHYYAANFSNSCWSETRLDVIVKVNSTPVPIGPYDQFFCFGASLGDLVVSGSGIKWYYLSTGGDALASDSRLLFSTPLYASQTLDGLESCARTSFMISILPDTMPPGAILQEFCKQGLVSDLTTYSSNDIRWYGSASGNDLLVPSTSLISGNHYYASQIVGSCESTKRLDVTVVVNPNTPSAPIGESAQTICGGYVDQLKATGNHVLWYDSLTSSTPIFSGKLRSKHYYATQTISACESVDRLKVLVTVLPTPAAPIGLIPGWSLVSAGAMHSIGIKKDGTLWAWGDNEYFQLGAGYAGEIIQKPILITEDNDWMTADAGSWHNAAIKNDGSLWVWGLNYTEPNTGMDSHQALSQYPIQKGNDKDWKSISAGHKFTLLLKSNGTLWSWENQEYNDVPILQIGTDEDWVSISAGDNHSLALKADSSLWAWGYNTRGQLGDGSTTNRSIPVKIGGDNKWKYIAAGATESYAIKTDGSLWTWGYDQLFPMQIGVDHNWQSVASNSGRTTLVKTDGTMWLMSSPSSLHQVTTSKDWLSISSGPVFSLAVKKDGTLWSWGEDLYGQLGLGFSSGSFTDPNQVHSAAAYFQNICGNASVGDIIVNGDNIKWYSTSEDIVPPIDPGTLLVNGNHYYGTQTVNTCESYDRLDILLVDKGDRAPTGFTVQSLCTNATIADLIVQGMNIKWYDVSIGGTPLSTTTQLVHGTQYYCSQTISTCESLARLGVRAELSDVTSPLGNSSQTFCYGATISSLNTTGQAVQWYATPSGGMPLSASTPLLNNFEYYASQTINLCESKDRLKVTISITTTSPPIGDDKQIFCEGASLKNLQISGTSIKWYAVSTNGEPLMDETILVNSTTYFASQTMNSCESKDRLEINATIKPRPEAPTGETIQVISPEQTIGDLVITGTQIKWYNSATDVRAGINDLQPSTLLIDNATYFATQTISGCESYPLAVKVSFVTEVESPGDPLKLYPNPVSQTLRISNGSAIRQVTVINSIGQKIMNQQLNDLNFELDLSNLKAGIYYLQIETTSELILKKILKD